MSVPLPKDLQVFFTCSKCGFFVSFGPVAKSLKGYHCGRCTKENDERRTTYEALARPYIFPCKYKNFGCDVFLPFGTEMKSHEMSCSKKPYKLKLPTLSLMCGKVTTKTLCVCKNRMFGCNYIKYSDEIREHERTCFVYGCPLGERVCGWRGIMEWITNHCWKQHQLYDSVSPAVKLKEILRSEENTFFYIIVIICSGRCLYFRVCIKTERIQRAYPSLYIAVQFIDDEADKAKEYICYADIEKSSGIKFHRRLKFCCSPYTLDEDAFKNCTHIPIKHFRGSTLHFNIALIKRNIEL